MTRSYHKFTLEEFELHNLLLSSYAWYARESKNPISQIDYMMQQVVSHCRENRLNFSKEAWRKFVIKIFTPLHACELIEELQLNEL